MKVTMYIIKMFKKQPVIIFQNYLAHNTEITLEKNKIMLSFKIFVIIFK